MIILFRLYSKGWYYQRAQSLHPRTHRAVQQSVWYFLGVDHDDWHLIKVIRKKHW